MLLILAGEISVVAEENVSIHSCGPAFLQTALAGDVVRRSPNTSEYLGHIQRNRERERERERERKRTYTYIF